MLVGRIIDILRHMLGYAVGSASDKSSGSEFWEHHLCNLD
jgi:hypothetical protein